MERIFELNLQTRKNYLELLSNYPLEQLNKIPSGFSNNLIWNAGHIIATMDVLCYKLFGLPTNCSDIFIGKYRKGTKPEGDITQDDLELIKKSMLSQIVMVKKDYESSNFKTCTPYMTSFGNEIKNIEDALTFNLIHEALHFGIMLNIKKFV